MCDVCACVRYVQMACQLLVDLAAATSMAIAARRVVGDDGQPIPSL